MSTVTKQSATEADAHETKQTTLYRANRVMAGALLLIIEKTPCATGDLVSAVEAILKTLPPHYLRRLITVAQKQLDSRQ